MLKQENVGKPATIYDVAEVVGKAFTLSIVTRGFQVIGLHPLNEDIFQDYEFLPSIVTNLFMHVKTNLKTKLCLWKTIQAGLDLQLILE